MTSEQRATALAMLQVIYEENPAGCCLHIVSDDGNSEDDCVDFCIEWAIDHQHPHCEATARFLRSLSEDDRDELYEAYDEYADRIVGGDYQRKP